MVISQFFTKLLCIALTTATMYKAIVQEGLIKHQIKAYSVWNLMIYTSIACVNNFIFAFYEN